MNNEYELYDFLKVVFFTLENPPFMQKIGVLFAAICRLVFAAGKFAV